ncbi:G-type lectin S-receptor-like serine/threonine-protein kinase LECRK1 [Tanacetum coccineum]
MTKLAYCMLDKMTAIAQTHHRNLVRLLGFCIHGATKLLVYEFMSNGSLPDLLLDSKTHPGWKEHVRLALDVARAKISDFGLSKLLRPNHNETLTSVSNFCSICYSK